MRVCKRFDNEGSSPLTRGKRSLTASGQTRTGLIPAHAGKTKEDAPVIPPKGAHPRSRGENRCAQRWVSSRHGSSPLTRGKRHVRLLVGLGRGLIPAHAGKTTSSTAQTSSSGAHPRSRGENASSPRHSMLTAGSSPLTRGKLPSRRNDASQDGLIPAQTGKTSRPPCPSSSNGAHPRSRGENPLTGR